MSSNILLSQIAWEVALDAETYSALVVDWATTLCFFDNQEQMLDPKKKAQPEVLFMSSVLQAQSLSK